MFFQCAVIFILAFLTVPTKEQNITKPHRLAVLVVGWNGPSAKVIGNFLFNTVNNRTDILPDYHIEMVAEEEGAASSMVPKVVVSYNRLFEQGPVDGLYQSPIIVGPYTSPGCKAIGTFLHHVNSVTIAPSCMTAVLEDHKKYPNLYLLLASDPVPMAIVHFIKEVGKWNRIGIVTDATRINDYSTAQLVQQLATANGINVAYFNMILDIDDELMQMLKANDLRVIITIMTNGQLTWKFLCQTYKFGLTGARYAFTTNIGGYSDPSLLPDEVMPGCRRETIIEQLKTTFWPSSMQSAISQTAKCVLGYNCDDFETMLLRDNFNYARPYEYEFRYVIHDSILKGLMNLDALDKVLKSEHNLTLRDFSDNPALRKKIMMIANQTVLQSEVSGLRIGPIRYNERGVVGTDVGIIMYWTPMNGLQTFYRTNIIIPGSNNKVYTNYELQNIRGPFDWKYGWKGKVPQGGSKSQKVILEVSVRVLYVVCTIAGVFGALRTFALLATVATIRKSGIHQLPRLKCCGYFGCLILDAVAVLFVIETTSAGPWKIWSCRIVLLLIGMSLEHGVHLVRIVVTYREIKKCLEGQATERITIACPRQPSITSGSVDTSSHLSTMNKAASLNPKSSVKGTSTSNYRPASSMNRTATVPVVKPDDIPSQLYQLAECSCLKGLLAFVAANANYLVIWLLSDPLKCQEDRISAYYVYESDTFLETYISTCRSDNHFAWIIAIAAAHLVALAVGVHSLYRAKKDLRGATLGIENAYIGIGINNAITLLGGSMLLLAVVGNENNQQIVIAFTALTTSAVSSITWLAPFLRSNAKPSQVAA